MHSKKTQVLAYQLTRAGGERLRQMVAASPRAQLAGLVASAEEFERKAVQVQPEIMLVEYDPESPGLQDMLGRLRRSVPGGSVVAYAQSQDPEVILRAMRLGVREYLPASAEDQQFNDAVQRLWRESAAGHAAGRLLAVMGVKGGVGTSSLVLSLAWIASQELGSRVALIDLDLAKGDLASLLDLPVRRSLAQVAEDYKRLDSLLMDSLLHEVAPGLRFLAAPGDAVVAEEIKAPHVERALEHLQENHSLVLADLPPRMEEAGLATLDRAEMVLLVTEPTVLGLKAARRMLELGRSLGHHNGKLKVVINRYGAKQCVPAREVERVLADRPLAYLPNDSVTLMQAANAGRPAARDWPRSKWSRETARLARLLLDGQGGAA
ncbi:MAG: cellulose synthase operon protein YhjQ/BcsQ [Thermodesulfobacteriota bacterium]